MRRRNLWMPATAAAAVIGLGTAGCGGGGGNGGGGTGGGSARSVSINAVQGARQTRNLLGIAVTFGFGGTPARQSSGRATATTAARSATRIAAWARQNTLKSLQKGAATRQAGEVIFDETYQLYSTFEESDTAFRLNYFRDAAATQSAGFISLATQGDPLTFPLTFVLNYNLTAGEEPGSGRLNIRVNDENGETTRVSGTVSDSATGVKTEFDLTFVDFGNSTTGDIRVADSDGAVEFRNLAIGADGSFSADLVYGDVQGLLTEAADGGGTLTLDDPAGPVVCVWDAAGAGTITLPDGSVQTISDFDDEA